MSGEPENKKHCTNSGHNMEGLLLGMGNPLLDISAEVDEEFLKKYGLEANNAILADDSHKSLYDDLVEKFNVEYVPGGATQNTIRIAQWLIGVPKSTTFMGCIGKDKYGKILEQKTTEAGVKVSYQIDETTPTGTCAVLLTGKHRSLVAYLAAANNFKKEHLEKPENQALIEKARFYYISGYPLTVCPDAMLLIAKQAAANDKLFMMNLSAPFLCTFFKDQMLQVMPYVDILFGNESEAEELSKVHNFGTTDIKEIAIRASRFPKENGKTGRMIVFTQGAGPTVICKEGVVTEYPVIHIDPKNIVDTNGAGDAFVGGFLAELAQGRGLDECIRCANYAANMIIQRSGCSVPEKPTYSFGIF